MANATEGSDYFRYAMTATDGLSGLPSLIPTTTKAIGFIEYFFCVYITHRDGKGPFPLWMHLFYLAHDSTFSYLMALEAPKYDYHPWFTSKAIGLAVWSFLEIYCIYRAVAVECEGLFSRAQGPRRIGQACIQSLLLLLVFYVVIVIPIRILGPEAWSHWTLFTNVVMAVGPGPLWLERGSRSGTSLGLAGVIVLGTILTFWPYSQWVLELPSVFDDYVYYYSDAVCVMAAVYNFYIVLTLPRDAKAEKRE